MTTPSFPFADRSHRYRRLVDQIREEFGERLTKVTLNAGMTCPTRDGTLGSGGCTFCDPYGSGPEEESAVPLEEQVRRRRRGTERFIAYLQAFTNTYCPPAELEQLLARVASIEGVAGLVLGTRPDCVPDAVLDVLQARAKTTPLWVEYGLQSVHGRTLHAIRRGHTLADFIDALLRTHARGIRVVAHVILGLPGESREDMNETARVLTALRVDGVKIHVLHIVRGSPMAAQYLRGEIELLTRDEYVSAACDFLERLHPSITIHRLTGERPAGMLIAPEWVTDKHSVLRQIGVELERRDSWQGRRAHLGLRF